MKCENIPLGEWKSIFSQWDPKKDFARAMLHAERLTQMLADMAVVEELEAQAKAHPARAELLERYLEHAEPRGRFLYEEITTTGIRLLCQLENEQTQSEVG